VSVGLVFPYYIHGDLHSFLKAADIKGKIRINVVKVIFKKVTKALQNLHKAGIVHRDLKE
jgi:serine/threonine protein kinase